LEKVGGVSASLTRSHIETQTVSDETAGGSILIQKDRIRHLCGHIQRITSLNNCTFPCEKKLFDLTGNQYYIKVRSNVESKKAFEAFVDILKKSFSLLKKVETNN
jgi:hypothetical protein